MSRSEVRGHGRQKGIAQTWRGAEYVVDFIPKSRIRSGHFTDDKAEGWSNIICDVANTNHIGDGKISLIPIKDAIRVRTEDVRRNPVGRGDDRLACMTRSADIR